MMKSVLPLFTVFLFLVNATIAQSFDFPDAEKSINKAIQKVYPACVRMYGYDTIKKTQNSAQFSGVVVSAEGHILTVAHAVSPNRIYKVSFPDGNEYLAMALGRIETEAPSRPDVAMMKILNKGSYPFAEMGVSSSLKINQSCFGISYPESLAQLQPMVRFGSVTNTGNQWGFMESSCIMETGDSGGPLFDLSGRVIGLHSRIDKPEGENYEVPVDLYRKYWTALQTAQNYTAWPSIEDPLTGKTIGEELDLQPAPTSLENDWKKKYYKEEKIVVITSTLSDSLQNINGAVFTNEGLSSAKKGKGVLVVSKSSMIGQDPVVLLPGGKKVKADILARDTANDLVLLSIAASLPNAIKISAMDTGRVDAKEFGRFLFSILPKTGTRQSVVGSGNFVLPARSIPGYFGAPAIFKNGKVTIRRIDNESPAAKAGLAVEDAILTVNGVAMTKPEDYGTELMKYQPGEKVSLTYERNGNTFTNVATLATPPTMPARHPADRFEGGKSVRRDGFKNVFVHDSRIKSYECGGPVFDAAGRLRGINIARFSHTTTVVIPAAVVYGLINGHIKN